MLKTKRYFLSFFFMILVILTSIAYLGNKNQNLFIYKLNYETDLLEKPVIKSELYNKTFNYFQQYPWVRQCGPKTNALKTYESSELKKIDYSTPADPITHRLRITRAILVYFPIEQVDNFHYEFRWLYRSWTEMIKHEPSKWRTDLVVFARNEKNFFNNNSFFDKLNCSFYHKRTSPNDKPMCVLMDYEAIKDRKFSSGEIKFASNNQLYNFILKKINIFNESDPNMNIFYDFIKNRLSKYGYVDSILMAFDGYKYFQSAGYDFLIRSDMDVFLTPLFAKWLPKHCNDFYVGRGGYSNEFNTNRLARIAHNLGLEYAGSTNLGSTWYSTPDQFRLVSYLTLFGMAYLSNEEFSTPEREGKLGVQLWPDWHYGVLLLYGQNLLMNHLIKTGQLNIVKLFEYLDYPSHYNSDVNNIIHIHIFHGIFFLFFLKLKFKFEFKGSDMFSKFEFKAGKYDKISYNKLDTKKVKFYSLKMALEGKILSPSQLLDLLNIQSSFKN